MSLSTNMEISQIEELLNKIQSLQSIMIAVSTGEERIQDVEENYSHLYQEVDLDIELIQEEGLSVFNPNSFASLWDWYNYWSSNLNGYASRRKYVYDLYVDITNNLDHFVQNQVIQHTSNSLNDTLKPERLERLLREIEQLQVIMVNVATDSASIQTEETSYVELHQVVSSYIRRLQQVGLQSKNPNDFSSLWHWHSYWKSELGDYASRRQFVGDLYTNIITPVQKALRRHQQRSTSIEEFTLDLQRRFNEQISEQPLPSTPTSSIVVEQKTNTKLGAVLIGSIKALDADSTRAIDTQLPAAVPSIEPRIDFAIITAIKAERLAVLKAFEIDEKKDRNRSKGSRTYWRKRLPLQDGRFYEVVVAQSLDIANVNAAILTNDMLHHWKPAAVLMVGIAAAAKPEAEQHIGDLIIGRDVYYYETGKITAEGRLPEPKNVPVSHILLDRVQALPESNFSILVDRPDGTNIRPKVELGVIASGDKVIAHAAERDSIAATNRKILAIEMEAYGVIEAVRQSPKQIDCLVIRSLCDYADSNKHDQWHSYAAAVAAGFTKHFLLDEPLDPRNPPTEAEHNSRSKVTA
jgi:nucleoside phosphorylase